MDGINTLDLQAFIIKAVTGVFDMMLSMEVELGDEAENPNNEEEHIVGAVSFAGEVMGSISIKVTSDFARQMTMGMLGMEEDEIDGDDEIKDVIGEVSNIIGGNLKSNFVDAGFFCELSIPSITTGSDFIIQSLDMETYERLFFHYNDHLIIVELGVKMAEISKAAKNERADQKENSEDSIDIEALLHNEEQSNPVEEAAEEQIEVKEDQKENVEQIVETKPDRDESLPKAGPDTQANKNQPNIGFILDIPVEITVELGHTDMKIKKMLRLGRKSIIKLSELKEQPVNILINGVLIARGEVLVEKEKYAIRIIEITSRMGRIRSLK